MQPDPTPSAPGEVCQLTPDLANAYSPESFRVAAHALADQAADYLRSVIQPTSTSDTRVPVLPWARPDDLYNAWPGDFENPSPAALAEWVARILAQSNHLHHPNYVGHQVTAPLPVTALLDLVSTLLNNGTAIYEMGAVSTVTERRVLEWFAHRVDLPPTASGVLTSGGSAGNLTALLAARQARAGFDVWSEGAHAGPPLAFLCSDQSHYCIRRSAQIMGWGAQGVFPAETDDHFRLRPESLPKALETARKAGRHVLGVVANAGSTSTGSIDPLQPIADFCAREGLWLHVDGAHGAALAISDRLKPRLAGIDRADSIVWDPHKMLLMPALVTAVLFRSGRDSYSAFAQEAAYLFNAPDPSAEWFNIGTRTLECTKRMLSIQVYVALQLHGRKFFAEYIERMVALAQSFARRIQSDPDFELAAQPDCNIVCFRCVPLNLRHLPPDPIDSLQLRVRQAIIESGDFYLVTTRLRGRAYLRTTLINPLTTEQTLDALLQRIRQQMAHESQTAPS